MAQLTISRTSAAVQNFHAKGKQVIDKCRKAGAESRFVVSEMAAVLGVSISYVNKARLFAQLYNDNELAKLLALRQPDGKPLGIGHICELIEVKDDKRRHKLQVQAAQQGWSVRALKAKRIAITGKHPRASKGGRRPRLPATQPELMVDLKNRIGELVRWLDALEERETAEAKTQAVGWNSLPRDIRQRIRVLDRELRWLSVHLNSGQSE